MDVGAGRRLFGECAKKGLCDVDAAFTDMHATPRGRSYRLMPDIGRFLTLTIQIIHQERDDRRHLPTRHLLWHMDHPDRSQLFKRHLDLYPGRGQCHVHLVPRLGAVSVRRLGE
jgi:hypothetical protein